MSSAGDYSFDIAIIGMSGRFPGAKNLEEFWQRLAAGEELITKFSHDDLLSRGLDRASLDDPAWVKAEGSLEGVDLFDAAFFDFSPREAESMDPQQRLFLEAAWEALENAAYDPDTYEGRIGVYAGSSLNSYLPYNLQSNPGLLETLGPFQLIIGGGTDHLPTQVSYKLNLTGPSVNVQTACSTSLVAVHLACQSLLGRECDIALAGGVSVSVPQGQGYRFEDGSIMSPDGHCRTFDANAAGTVPASGLGIVVLKRLSEALADRDFIHAVIKGTAINNDGGEKAGYTAPSVEGQATVIQEALAAAGVDADSIQYVEAHGTATPLGDPIEVAGLTRAFRSSTDRNQFCRIGSLKTNVGHLDAASGIGGLIKTVLALEHQQLPPTLHFRDPNPKIDFKQSPFFVDTSLAPWPSNGTPRLAGVSSFGIGGTNAHVIVGESQEAEVSQAVQGSTVPNRPWELIVVSARTPSALDSATRNLADALRQRSDLDLRDVAYTLRVGRKRFAHRRAVACESIEDAIAKLNSSVATAAALSQTTETRASTEERRPRVAFVFPGQGSQYVGMARDLYNLWPSFRDTVDRCCQILKPLIGVDLREVVFADHESTSTSNGKLDHTLVAQPALFVIEYSLARLWMELGIVPDSMIGHSIGEYVAACISGVFSLEAALALVAERARLMARVDGGTMLAVPLGEEAIQSFISRRQSVSVAAVNGPKLTVVSGATGAIEEVEQELRDAEIAAARLHVSHAFHSQMMDPVLDDFQNRVKSIKLNVPAIPYISNLTGTWITADQAMSASYYSDHLRNTVRFWDGIENLISEPDRILLEIGPGQLLKGIAGLASSSEGKRTILKTLRHPKESCNDYGFLLSTLGQLWASGIPVDWKALHQDEPCSRVQLPTYPFERQRYWIESGQRSADQSGGPLARNPNQPEWFYLPSWTRTAGRPVRSPAPSDQTDIADKVTQVGDCLVFCDALGIGDRIAALIRSEGGKATTVHSGGPFNQINAESYSIDPANREDYQQLLEATLSSGVIPKTILHLWNVTADSTGGALSDTYKDGLTYAFSSLVFLAQAIGEHASDKKIKLMVVSNGLYDVIGTEALVPIKALTRGPCKVIPLEYSNVSCISVDVSTPDLSEQSVSDLACCLILETASGRHDSTVAYRSRHRWVQGFEHVIFEGRRAPEPIFKPGGVYLFTGGLSEVEFALARQSAETSPTRLAFIGLPELPPRSEWASFVAGEGQTPAGNAIAMIRELESLDAAVLPVQAEISNRESMSAALQRIRMEFGPINGVIHSAFKPGGGMVQLKTLASAEEVFAPKVLGTIMLHELLQDDPLDFFVIFASSFSILGAFGQVDYCAANAFVDAFAAWQASQSGPPAVAIDWHITGWEIWQETAMAAAPHIQAQLQKVRTDYGVTAQEAVSCVSEVIPRGIPQIVVSTQDFLRVLKEQDPATSNLLEQFGSLNFAAASQERAGTGSYVEPAGEIEQAIAAIWQDVFGITQIGAKDDFFDTGGNSLMAIQVISKLRKNFHVGLPLSSLFEHPTVEGLAAEIQAAGARAEEMAQIESLLAEIEDLSPEQVASALAAEEPS